MALPTNTFRPKRYFRSKFTEGKFLLAAEATDVQLELQDLIREFQKNSYGSMAVQSSFNAEQDGADKLVLRPGEAWDSGIPFVMKSGTDPKVISGVLPAGVAFADRSATTSDVGGKDLDLSGGLADGSYSVVLEATEELVRPIGTGAVDPYLQGANVGEETQNKLRLVYKAHVVEQTDLTQTPTYPLAITNHFVNEIIVTPTGSENFLISAIDITQDPNGADRRIILDNSAGNLPFSTDADEYINGILIDSDGNSYHITSITTTDGGLTVQMLLDREVDINSALPKAGLPVITNNVSYRLRKREFYVTATTGAPLGRHYYRVADFDFAAGALTSLTDLRTVTAVNSFGVDPSLRLTEGGLISWNSLTGLLSHDAPFRISLPGNVGSAIIPVSTPFSLASNGDVLFFFLDRDATGDYNVTLTSTAKTSVPANVDVYLFAERRNDRIYFPHGGSIGHAERGILGSFGATLNKDLSIDFITDSLTENQMDEVFAETFDSEDSVDLVATQAMTYEPFEKQYRAAAGSRFLDYEADVTPDDGGLPATELWTKIGAQAQSLGGGLLTLTDVSVGDRVTYQRTESSLVPLAQSDHLFRCRINSNGAEPTHYFRYDVEDSGTGKAFGIALDGTTANLIDGLGNVLQSVAVDTAIMHDYRLVKLGDIAVQWYTDGVLRGVQKYSDIPTAGSASTVTWGTVDASTAVVDIDSVRFDIYGSVLQSLDFFRQGNVFYDGDVLPASEPTNPWTLNDGGGGISQTVTAEDYLNILDNSAVNQINFERTESALIRQGDGSMEMRVKVDSGSLSNFLKFGVRLQDGKKDAAAYVRDDGGQLKAGIYNGSAGTLISLEHNIDSDAFVVLKLKKIKDVGYQLFVNGVIQDSISYEEVTDTTADNKLLFGCFDNTSNFEVNIDFVQYALPGVGDLANTPVQDMLSIIASDDPCPKSWVSTDDGISWHEMIPEQASSITNLDLAGGNLKARILLSTVGSILTDYGVLYNKTGFAVEGQFNYDQQTAAAGQTVFTLPFNYNPSIHELIVHYRPVATGETRKLTESLDYNEVNANQIELTFPAILNDVLELRNSFVKDPIVPPPVRFIAHNHDGGSGESDALNPTTLDVTGAVTLSGAAGHSVSPEFANEVIDEYERPTGVTVAERGVAESVSSGTDTTNSPTLTDIANLTVTITTNGRPVVLQLVGVNTSTVADDTSYIKGAGASNAVVVAFLRDAAVVSAQTLTLTNTDKHPVSALSYIDSPTSGTYTYKMQWRKAGGTDPEIKDAKLVAYEL